MKLAERIEKALEKHNLCVFTPITEEETPQEPQTTIVISDANYKTVAEGLKHLNEHETDEDGIGYFTAKTTGLGKIQLPMVVGDYVVEDIQRVKTGNYQVHFRKSEHNV